MDKNPYRGKFIVFEGLNGSGKTTQVNMLWDFMQKADNGVIKTKEPALDCHYGKEIYEVLRGQKKMSARQLQLLMVKNRKNHLNRIIIPAPKRKKTVLCDRYVLSTAAFGGLELDMEWLISLNQDFIWPDFTFLLDTPPKVCLSRIKASRNETKIFERKEKMIRTRENYYALSRMFNNIYIIKSALLETEVHYKIVDILKKKRG